MTQEAMKQALEALETPKPLDDYPPILNAYAKTINNAITSLRQAIAELESQEPVATVTSETGADITMSWWHEPALPVGTKLFTHPPQRTWVGLTDEEIADEFYKFESAGAWYQFTRAIEAKLKQKNGFAEEENT